MAKDSLPAIAADTERAGRYPRTGRGRSRGGGSSRLFVNAILVVVVVALAGAGWFIFEQHQRLIRGETALADAAGRIGMLEQRLRMTDEMMSESDTDITAKVSEWISEVDKLWANYRRHRDLIKALDTSTKALQSALAKAEGTINEVRGKVGTVETTLARQQDVADKITEVDIRTLDMIKQMRNVVDKANSAYQIASRLENSLAGDVAEVKTAIRAIDAHRVQVNADIAELRRMVDSLRVNSL